MAIAISDGSHYEKHGKDEVVCIDDEIPFEIPESWEWTRLESVTTYIQRGKSPKYSLIKRYPVVAQKCNQWTGFSLDKAKYIDPDTVSTYADERILQDGDLLWNSTGLGTLGRMAIYDSAVNSYGWAVADSHVTVIRTNQEWLLFQYAYLYFANPTVQRVIEEQSSGSTKQKELSQETVKQYLFPLPPLDEQVRIVNQVNNVNHLVEQYGTIEDEREALDAALPEQLRKSILQQAVEGKLVPQDPNDEPASMLLERIREEKRHLIAEGKCKAPKGSESVIYRSSDGGYYEKFIDAKGRESDPVCIDDEIPFDIPENWEWCRVGSIGDWKAGATPAKSNPAYHLGGTIPWLLTGNLNDGHVSDIPNMITQKALEDCSVRLNPVGAVLVAMYGATIGKIGILDIPATTNQACCACIPYSEAITKWLFTWLMFQKPYFVKMGEGGAQPNISRDKIVNCLFPIPPAQEQKRIIAHCCTLLDFIG